MKRFCYPIAVLFPILLTFALSGVVVASWRGSACGPVGSPIASVISGYQWKSRLDTPGQTFLFLDGKQIGAVYDDTGVYLPIVGDEWGEPTDPPVGVPSWVTGRVRASDRVVANFGIDTDKLGSGNRYFRNGQPIAKSEAHRLVESKIPDDIGKPRLTIVGSDEDRKKIERLLEDAGDMKDKVRIWSVAPDHWSLKDNVSGKPLFAEIDRPTIYLTDSTGRDIHRPVRFKGAEDFAAIRRAVNDYDPKKSPDLRPPNQGIKPPVEILCLLGGAVFVAFWMKGRKP